MSTETGVAKRRLSRSSSQIEEGASSTNISRSSKESDTTKHLDEQQQQQQQHGDGDGDGDKDENNSVKQQQQQQQQQAVGIAITASTSSTTPVNVIPGDGSRQVIAVSANKNPTAFFQLARKFLMTNDMCDLSALEGAIVSAVDAAHLLERSQLAIIVKIHTSYVNVEPKRRRQVSQQQQQHQQQGEVTSATATATEDVPSTTSGAELPSSTNPESSSSTTTGTGTIPITMTKEAPSSSVYTTVNDPNTKSSSGGGRELRRARILITVKRTESYKRWLEDNPLHRQAIIAGTAAEDIVGDSNKDNKNNVTTTADPASSLSRK